jgi:PRTRC genetic system protein A
LMEIEPAVEMEYPRIPEIFLKNMLEIAGWQRGKRGKHLEVVFRVAWNEEDGDWMLDIPAQEQYEAFCKPLSKEPENTLLEIHSHHVMPAAFSSQDNLDERGFRLYGVMGEFGKKPVLHLRLGIHGHFADVSASDFMELPDGLEDWAEKSQEEEGDCLWELNRK